MANPIVILGWTADDKVPGFYGETKFGQGRVSVGAFPVKLVITGTMDASSGTMTPDQDFEPILSVDDAMTKLGNRCTATQQARAALSIEGVSLYACPPSATGTSATLTISIGGSWGSAGTIKWYLDGQLVSTDIAASGETADDVEYNTAQAFNGWANGPVTGATAAGGCVLTVDSTGTQGNQYRLGWELDEAPAGLTVTVSGGTPIHDRMVPFAGGASTESVANIIDIMESEVCDYIAAAQTDATNLGLFEAHMASEAGPVIGHLEHMVCAQTGTLAAAQSISQTTLNDARSSVIWMQYCETHPAEIAAGVAALRSVIEPQNPNYNYDDFPLSFVTPQRWRADMAGHSTLKAALNTGLTPLKTENGVTKIVRGIVSRCLEGSSPNYNTLDWGDAIVPDRIRKELAASWVTFKASNPYVGRDIVGAEKAQPEGVGTPNLWNSEVIRVLKEAESNQWVQDVDDNQPQTVLDTARKALVSAVPVVVRWQQHSIGVSVRQQAA